MVRMGAWPSNDYHGEVFLLLCHLFTMFLLQGTPVKDVKLPDNPATKSLLLAKHADYIEAFEKNKDDYVSSSLSSVPSFAHTFSLSSLRITV